ncbi:TolC family protein [Flavobacterium sp. JP2137]|uniref:TolC family protein n=1 Tax=Flavobacterium sp. JP2137 TaxID=3414510 RepID=UPI003D2FC8A9
MQTKITYIKTALFWISATAALYAQSATLTMEQALRRAKNGNKTIQLQVLEEQQAREQLRESKSHLMPQIAANLGYSYYFDRQVIFLPGFFAGTTNPVEDVAVGGRNTYNGVVSLQQPIVAIGAQQLVKASKIKEKLEREKTADLHNRVALQVSTRYLEMLMMNRQLDLLEQSVERNKSALKDARALFAQGRNLKTDTLRSAIAVSQMNSSVSYLKNNIEVAGMDLKRLIGWEEAGELLLTDSLEIDPTIRFSTHYQLEEALQSAEEHRRDISMQKLNIDLQHRRIKVAQAAWWPQLSLIGQYQLQAQSDDLKLDAYVWPSTSFVGLQLHVPIFNGNRTHSQIRQAKIKAEQEALQLTDLQAVVKTELATLVSQWKEGITQLDIQTTTVKAAEVNHRMIESRFKNGLSSRLELTDAELALTQTKINYLAAVYQLRRLDIQLQAATGLLTL